MVLKVTNKSSRAANGQPSKGGGRPSTKKGSHVTQERAKAQRAKLDTQAETRQRQEEQAAIAQKTQQKKAERQEAQTKL